jgi:glycosyltransferase involved in cell wall biosynthesis
VPKIVLIHPNAGINWQENSSVFAIELARRLDNYFEVELLSGADCGSFSRPIKSITRSDVASLADHPFVSPILHRWFARSGIALEHLTSFLPCVMYLLQNPADLILPQNGYGGLLVAACIRAMRKTPILFTEHHSLLSQSKHLQRNLSLQPDRLITLNPIVAKYLHRLAPQQTIDTIPLGIDLREFSPEGKAIATGLPQPCIICVAPLERDSHHRLELTIEAVARLPQASLLICGAGSDRDYFQAMGDRLLGRERFQIRTFAYAQMPQVYRSGSIFTSAATQEPRGLKYIEAMASGLPVVATDDAIRRYFIGNGGITCDVTNLDLYAKSLQDAMNQHHYRQRHPRQNAFRFSWQGITLLYYQVILKTITNSNSQFAPLYFN